MPVNEVAGTVSHIVKQAISIPGLSEAAKLLDSLYKVAEDVRIRRFVVFDSLSCSMNAALTK
jgi:hypothetical protein